MGDAWANEKYGALRFSSPSIGFVGFVFLGFIIKYFLSYSVNFRIIAYICKANP